MVRRSSILRFGILVAGLALATASCSTRPGGPGGGAGQDGGTGTGQDGGAGMGGTGSPCTGDDDCRTGHFCSVVGICLADGSCRQQGDCGDAQVCGQGSRLCLDPDTCAVSGDCPSGQTCNQDTRACEIGGECGQTAFATSRLQPNVMVLLDRSGSMKNSAGDQSRWNAAKGAIEFITTAFDSEIHFGLATYSSCEGTYDPERNRCTSIACSAGSVVVELASTNASTINGFLADKVDQGSCNGLLPHASGGIAYLCDSGVQETSTGKSLHALAEDVSWRDPQRDNVVLLITDGEESGVCIEDDRDARDGAATLLAAGIRTFVVGLGVSSSTLNDVAVAGGTAQLYPADSEAELRSAFEEIAADVVSCDYALDEAPPSTDELYVYFNDDPAGIAQDAADGWIYDDAAMILRFRGAACEAIKSGTVLDIDVVFGCPGPIVD